VIDDADRPLALGIDLGGTNSKWVVALPGDGTWTVRGRGSRRTRAADGPDAVVAGLLAIGRSAREAWPGIATVGLGIPGLIDPHRGAVRLLPNFTGAWAGRAVAAELGAGLGLPAAIVNDARAFGLAETRAGAGRGCRTLLGVTLGTGVGGCVVVDGRLHVGRNGSAGELGHVVIDPAGPACGCGDRGCVEAYVAAARIAAACGTAGVPEAVAAARAGDPRAIDGLAAAGTRLGVGIANACSLLDPECVVVGGGVAEAGELLLGSVRAELDRRFPPGSPEAVRVVRAQLGTWAGAIGAAIHGAEAGSPAARPSASASAARGPRSVRRPRRLP
jgi:glucokinase